MDKQVVSRKMCSGCFLKFFESSVNQAIRRKIKANQTIILDQEQTQKAKITRHLIYKLIDFPINIEENGSGLIIYSISLNDTLKESLSMLSNDCLVGVDDRFSILKNFTDREIKIYADANKIDFEIKSDDPISKMLVAFENKLPESMFGLANSFEQISSYRK